MGRGDLRDKLLRIERLASDMNSFVPIDKRGATAFRADLAGLLVVAIASTYEDCVKQTLITHAGARHADFEAFSERHFKKLASKIRLSDLRRYSILHGAAVENRFKKMLDERKAHILSKMAVNITDRYDQLLNWRNDYAHEGKHNTTIEEAMNFHRFALRVIFAFNQAFSC